MKILKLTPAIKDNIWGGTRLSKEFEMVSFTDRQAEAWVLSCHGDGECIIENIAPENKTKQHEGAVKKQKLKQKSQQYNKKQGTRSHKKETEQERLKRIQEERSKRTIVVTVGDEITVGELASQLKLTASEVIKKLFALGQNVLLCIGSVAKACIAAFFDGHNTVGIHGKADRLFGQVIACRSLGLLHAEDGGLVMYVKRLEAGRFKIPLYDKETKSYPMEWRDLVVMVEGIQESPEKRLRRLRAERKEYIV